MYVAIKHQITDPTAFQERGKGVTAAENLPQGVRPLQFFPKEDLSTAVCLYEGPSVDAVRQHVNGYIGDAARNEYFQVAEAYALGLPGRA
ncbi:MAG: DUF4242 domain-containing protein [Deinococcota bacterium]|jgi:hypothetical protein|nr:DUF4242 domain-containing protein [Deinococcota bacterium]